MTSRKAPSGSHKVPVLGWVLLAVLVAVGVGAWASGGLHALSLDNLAAHRQAIDAYVKAQPILAVGLFVLVYGVTTGACLPVALTLSLASGVLFGLKLGGVATAAGATLGATLTFLAASSALGQSIAKRVQRLPALEALLERARARPFRLVLAIRLIPFFPFAPINIAASLSGIPLGPYVAATLLGVIPTSFIYAGVGAGLDGAMSHAGRSVTQALTSPQVLWPLAALATLSIGSLVARPLLARLQRAG